MKNKKPTILFLDIETTPNLAYVWGKYQQDVIEFDKETQILSISWKEQGSSNVRFVRYPSPELLCRLLNRADIVVAHNGKAFDLKHIHREILQGGLKPPSPYSIVDTLTVARKHFKFNSNKLGDLGKSLKIGTKVQTGGFKLWLDCLAGKSKAWDKMERYNKQDVVLLEKVYDKLLPWIDNHPSIALLKGRKGCANCGSRKLHSKGYRVTTKTRYQRFQCQDCGAPSQVVKGI